MKFGTKVACLMPAENMQYYYFQGKIINKWQGYVKVRTENCQIKDLWLPVDAVSALDGLWSTALNLPAEEAND